MPARAQGDIGFIIEIDFHYHEETHKRNNDLPAGPETMKPDKISPFNASHYVGEIPTKKLIAHLGEHNNFVCHYMEAQEIIRQGGVVTKIHKILQFRQEAFASEYVILNNNRRKEATSKKDEFGKDFFKLMNNYCYGQMMMNEREFKHGEFFSGTKKIRGQEVSKRKLAISDAKYLDHYDLDNKNTFVIRDQMNTITKPIACGVSILGISKAYMVSMWYKLVDKFGADNIFLIFTDTDSLVFGLKGNTYKEADIFSYIREEPEFAQLFDLDGVPEVEKLIPGNPYWSLKNKKVMGKFKFEVLGIGEIGANAPKSNSILVVDEDETTSEPLKRN